MIRLVVAAAFFAPVLMGAPAQAFWKRSHWAACNEASTQAERLRRQCWIFEPVQEWPAPALFYESPGYRAPGDVEPQRGGSVVRRLG